MACQWENSNMSNYTNTNIKYYYFKWTLKWYNCTIDEYLVIYSQFTVLFLYAPFKRMILQIILNQRDNILTICCVCNHIQRRGNQIKMPCVPYFGFAFYFTICSLLLVQCKVVNFHAPLNFGKSYNETKSINNITNVDSNSVNSDNSKNDSSYLMMILLAAGVISFGILVFYACPQMWCDTFLGKWVRSCCPEYIPKWMTQSTPTRLVEDRDSSNNDNSVEFYVTNGRNVQRRQERTYRPEIIEEVDEDEEDDDSLEILNSHPDARLDPPSTSSGSANADGAVQIQVTAQIESTPNNPDPVAVWTISVTIFVLIFTLGNTQLKGKRFFRKVF